MRDRSRALAAGSLVAVALSSVALVIATRHAPATRTARAGRDHVVRTFDQPDAAEAYYAARRVPLTPGIDLRERYRAAAGRLARMPRHATTTGRRLPSLQALGATAAPLAWPAASGAGAERAAENLEAWIPLGPGNIGGRTRVLAIDPQDPNRMYTGGVSGGVWKTEDAGKSWRPVGDQLANLAINAMAMSPRDPRVLLVGTGEGYFREDVRYTGLPLRGGGIFVTKDAGESWTHLPATASADFHFVNEILISPHDDRVVYAATRTGVWRSRDRGASWEWILPTTVRGGCLDLALRTDLADDVLFASCGTFEQATVYRSADPSGAAAFISVLTDPGMGRTTLAIAPSDQSVMYALSASNVPGPNGLYEQALHAVFRSTDGGAPGSWTAQVRNTDPVKLRTLILTNPIAASYVDCRFSSSNAYTPMGWYVSALAVDPIDPRTVCAAGVDWFRSRDGGRTWGVVSEWWHTGVGGFVHADQHALVFHPGFNGTTNQQAYAMTDGGIYRTDNARGADSPDVCNPATIGVSWTSLNHNLGITQFYHGLPFPDGAAYIGGTQDNGTLAGTAAAGTDGWFSVYGGDGGYVAFEPGRPNVIYVESQWADIVRSADGGRTFTNAGTGLDPRASNNIHGDRANFLFVTPLVADPNLPGTVWTGGRYVYRRDRTEREGAGANGAADRSRRSDDPGPIRRRDPSDVGAVLWQRASEQLLDEGLVSAIATVPGRPGRIAVGATDGRIYVTDEGRSASEATRWDLAAPRRGWVTSVAFDPSNPDVLYATYGGFGGAHVFRSADLGRTWRSIDGTGDTGIPDVPVHVLVVDPARSQRLFLGSDVGVLVSDTGGDEWAVENTGFGAIVTEWLAPLVLPNGERWLFAFTHGRGAWKVRLR